MGKSIKLPCHRPPPTQYARTPSHTTGADTVVLGGTLQKGDYDTSPRQEDTDGIMQRATAIMPSLRAAKLEKVWVSRYVWHSQLCAPWLPCWHVCIPLRALGSSICLGNAPGSHKGKRRVTRLVV